MSVIIDMPMPKNCHDCYLSIWAEGEYWCPWNNCTVDGINKGEKQRMSGCPLEPYREDGTE